MPADAARCDAANTEDPNREAVAGRAPPEEQDVVDLVFMEYYLADFVTTHGQYDGAKFTGILAKSAKQMSPRGRAAALTLIELPPELAPLDRTVMEDAAA